MVFYQALVSCLAQYGNLHTGNMLFIEQLRATWNHPGGKLIEFGPATLTDQELLAVLIVIGYKGRSAK